MKRVLGIVLAAVLLLSTLSLVSCSSVQEVDSINGKTAKEAYFDAMELIHESERYEVVVDMSISFNLLFIPIPVDINGFYFYSYDGANEHHGLTEAGDEFINNDFMQTVAPDTLSGYDKELWYVDGIFYQITSSGEKLKYTADSNPIRRSDLESEVNEILEHDIAEATCYKQGDQYFFELILTGNDVRLDIDNTTEEEIYRVYFDEKGYIDTIDVESKSEGFTSTFTMHYTYSGLAPITPPADAASFRDCGAYFY